jgi:hypothetical protein
MCFALLRSKNIDVYFHCDHFEWYADEFKLKKKLNSDPFEIPVLSTTIERYYGMHMEENVVNLKEKVLYLRRCQNDASIYDMMYVAHAEKKITMFQIAKKNGNSNVFQMEMIDEVFEKMCVKNEKYTVHLVFVNDWNEKTATGFLFLFFLFLVFEIFS